MKQVGGIWPRRGTRWILRHHCMWVVMISYPMGCTFHILCSFVCRPDALQGWQAQWLPDQSLSPRFGTSCDLCRACMVFIPCALICVPTLPNYRLVLCLCQSGPAMGALFIPVLLYSRLPSCPVPRPQLYVEKCMWRNVFVYLL